MCKRNTAEQIIAKTREAEFRNIRAHEFSFKHNKNIIISANGTRPQFSLIPYLFKRV